MQTPSKPNSQTLDRAEAQPERPAYETPRVLKKRSVERVTLFSGGGVAGGGGITAAG